MTLYKSLQADVRNMITSILIWSIIFIHSGVFGTDPVLTPGPTVTVPENQPLTLTCVYTSSTVTSQTIFRWHRDGIPFLTAWYQGCTRFNSPTAGYTDSCDKSSDTYTFTLTTPGLTRADDGQTWQCAVQSSPLISTSGLTTLTVQSVSAHLVLTPGPIATVTEHQPLTLTCVYTASTVTGDTTFQWHREGALLYGPWVSGCTRFFPTPPGYADSCVKSQDTYTFTLTTPTLTREDDGTTWLCRIDIPPSTVLDSVGTTVSVEVPISNVVLSPPGSTVPVIADRANTFVCETAAGRPAASIRWYRNTGTSSSSDVEITGGTTTSRPSGDGLIITRGTLQYTPTRAMAGWRIFCTASNTAGDIKTSLKPTLDVQYPPSVNPIPDQRVIEGSPVPVTCTMTSSNPSPTTYTWTRSTPGSWSRSGAAFPISSVQKTDAATYTCIATNTMVGPVTGRGTEDFILTVLFPPTIPTFSVKGTSVSSRVREVRGKDLHVTCTSSGNPSPTYRWTGPQLGAGQQGQVLTLQPVLDGVYTCTVTNTLPPTNQASTNQASITVETLYAPSKPTFLYNDATGSPISTNTPLSVVEEDDFRVACVSSGNPSPGYQWTPQGTSDRILNINNIGRDVNIARCTATNTLSPTVGTSTTGTSYTDLSINVMYGPSKPKIRYSSGSSAVVPSQLRVIRGQSVRVSCSDSTSNPGATYSWSGPKSSSDGSLIIQNIAPQDTGQYTCIATNTMDRTFGSTTTGTKSATLTVDVLFAPVVNQIPDQAIEENTGLSITCRITPGNPASTTYRWTRDTDSWSQTGQTLILTPRRNDTARYTCTATNNMQPSQGISVPGTDSKSFNVNVYFKSSITTFVIKDHQGTNITINETEASSFTCSATSNPASTITVSKDTNMVAQSDNTQQVEYPINNATCEDTGVYTCTAYNQYNGDEHATTPAIQLNILCKPRPKYSATNNITLYTALLDPLTLNLTIVAYPRPHTYIWSKMTGNQWTTLTTSDSVNISSETVGSTPSITFVSTLNISSIELADFGQYKLEIQNGIGNGSVQHFTVISQDKPQTPTEVDVIDGLTTPTTATIIWKPGFNGGLTQTFHLQYRTESDTNWTEKTVRANDLIEVDGMVNYTLTQLSADTTYTFRLFSRNTKGDSGITTLGTFSTQVPPTADPRTSSTVAAVAGSLSGLLVVGIVVAVCIVVRRRQAKGNPKSTRDMRLKQRGGHPTGDMARVQDHVYENQAVQSQGVHVGSGTTSNYEALSQTRTDTNNTYAMLNPGSDERGGITSESSVATEYEQLSQNRAGTNSTYETLQQGATGIRPEIYENLKI